MKKAEQVQEVKDRATECSKEVEDVLKKYNCHFETQWAMQAGQGGIPFVNVRIAIVPNA